MAERTRQQILAAELAKHPDWPDRPEYDDPGQRDLIYRTGITFAKEAHKGSGVVLIGNGANLFADAMKHAGVTMPPLYAVNPRSLNTREDIRDEIESRWLTLENKLPPTPRPSLPDLTYPSIFRYHAPTLSWDEYFPHIDAAEVAEEVINGLAVPIRVQTSRWADGKGSFTVAADFAEVLQRRGVDENTLQDVQQPNFYKECSYLEMLGLRLRYAVSRAMNAEEATASHDEIEAMVADSMPELLDRDDDPVTIFDSCLHTGFTVMKIQSVFNRVGVQNTRFGVLTNAENTSSIQPAIIVTEDLPKQHYPFGVDYSAAANTPNKILVQPALPIPPDTNDETRKIVEEQRKETARRKHEIPIIMDVYNSYYKGL